MIIEKQCFITSPFSELRSGHGAKRRTETGDRRQEEGGRVAGLQADRVIKHGAQSMGHGEETETGDRKPDTADRRRKQFHSLAKRQEIFTCLLQNRLNINFFPFSRSSQIANFLT